MDMKAQQGYSKSGNNSIKNLLVTPSGRFLDEDGNTVTFANLDQYLTSKKDLFEKVANGELGSSTDPKYIKRALSYTNFDESPAVRDKHSDIVLNYDHLLIQGMPANLSTSDLEKYQKVVAEAFGNLDIFFTDGSPYLLQGKRQVIVRIDQNTGGTQSPHIHIVVARHSIADRKDLEEQYNTTTDLAKKTALKKAIDFSQGKDKVLMQSANFSTYNYVNKLTLEFLNNKLIENNLLPLTGFTLADGKGASNSKVSQESKAITKQIEEDNYSAEIVEKVIAQATEEKYSNLDNVIIQKRLQTNKEQQDKLTEELRRLTSESRTLFEAQTALTDNVVLKEKTAHLNNVVTELNAKLENTNNILEDIKEENLVISNEINKVKEKLEIQDKAFSQLAIESDEKNELLSKVADFLGTSSIEIIAENKIYIEVIKSKIEEKDNDYNNIFEELKEFKKETIDKLSLKDQEKINEINAVKAEFTDKLGLKDIIIADKDIEIKEKKIEAGTVKIELLNVKKVKETLEIQVSEGHKKNSDLINNNRSLQAEIDKLKADSLKQMAEFKSLQDEADKKLEIEKQKTIKLEKEILEKDKKFREFASNFVNEVSTKLKSLSSSISKLAKGITDPNKKKEVNKIATDIKVSLSDFTKKFTTTEKPEDNDNNKPNNNNPSTPRKN